MASQLKSKQSSKNEDSKYLENKYKKSNELLTAGLKDIEESNEKEPEIQHLIEKKGSNFILFLTLHKQLN